MIKGMTPKEALEMLPNINKRAAGTIFKAVNTSVANAKQKGADPGSLSIKEIQIQEGPMMKRWRAGAKGRAKPYKKKMSHIRIILETKEKVKGKAAKPKKIETKKGEGKIKKDISKKDIKRQSIDGTKQKKTSARAKRVGMPKIPAGGSK